MKSITTLVPDIYSLFEKEQKLDPEHIEEFGRRLVLRLSDKFGRRVRRGFSLSSVGKPCHRELYFSVNTPDEAEALSASTKLKFLFGDILEEMLLFLSRAAGHDVKSEQHEVEINGVKGHPDAIIDGRLVDVKSASSRSFEKFERNGLYESDDFGYLDQLFSYHQPLRDTDLLKDKETASFLVIDKQFGHIALDTYKKPDTDYTKLVEKQKEMLAQPEPPPVPAKYKPVKHQEGGNMKLCTKCSYCSYSRKCFDYRTFIYSNGPVHLTKVVKLPKVLEVDKDGKEIRPSPFANEKG